MIYSPVRKGITLAKQTRKSFNNSVGTAEVEVISLVIDSYAVTSIYGCSVIFGRLRLLFFSFLIPSCGLDSGNADFQCLPLVLFLRRFIDHVEERDRHKHSSRFHVVHHGDFKCQSNYKINNKYDEPARRIIDK